MPRVGGPLITATATGPGGTSEFSAPVTATDYAADLDGDGTVGFSDLLILAQQYGQPGAPQQGDIDLNGTVGFADLLMLAQTYGRTASITTAAARLSTLSQPDADGSVRKSARLTERLKNLA